jgi:hypothetical protein
LILLFLFLQAHNGDPLLGYIYGAKNGRNTAISSAIQGIARLQRWMTAPSWNSMKSINFWRQTKGGMRGLVLGKFHVVGGLTHVQRAVTACWEQGRVADKTKATIDGAMLKGIPNNIDLLKVDIYPSK